MASEATRAAERYAEALIRKRLAHRPPDDVRFEERADRLVIHHRFPVGVRGWPGEVVVDPQLGTTELVREP